MDPTNLDDLITALLASRKHMFDDESGTEDVCSKSTVNKSKTKKDTIEGVTENQLLKLAHAVRPVFMMDPILLKLSSPITVVGDLHGQYDDLLRYFKRCGMPPKTNYLFLGDYVDRVYGFFDECKRRYSTRLWKTYTDCFNCLPLAALINSSIFCVHGGLSPDLKKLDQLNLVRRPTEIPDIGIVCDLLWSDPDLNGGWHSNDRGVSYTFGAEEVGSFMEKCGLSLIVRAHQVVEDGYEFFANKKLVTIFSAANYCGEFDNAGAVMQISEDLVCSFIILKPTTEVKVTSNEKKVTESTAEQPEIPPTISCSDI
ncbi:hypothetical protein EG68_01259 [Paragonimus skrjabini miyazakii]|uniref:protein-serine/threonine phosphatase n=1 Tax=Paragonimus skrjabini miyazakii TaxID=59628 RepID=A0A8S9Z5H9_9TREM|nr:hypothetical protein EG68_01259 [Paragonimus skrjabini miyazakii]